MEAQRRYGVQTTFYFPLITKDATDFDTSPVSHASADTQISKDGGAFANTTNAFAHEGNGIYSLVITATEMQARVVAITIVDQGTKLWEDQCVIACTLNDASAEIPTFSPVAADVRSAVGLSSANLDTQLTAIDDYIDSEVSAIKAKTDNLPSDPADASDIAAAFSTVNTKLDTIDDYIDTEVAAALAAVDTEVGAIKAKTDLIPAAPAAVGDIPTAIQNADALLTRDVDNVEGSAPIHSLCSMILKHVSRFVASSGRTYRTDGSTPHMTQTPTTDAAADPVTELGVGA